MSEATSKRPAKGDLVPGHRVLILAGPAVYQAKVAKVSASGHTVWVKWGNFPCDRFTWRGEANGYHPVGQRTIRAASLRLLTGAA